MPKKEPFDIKHLGTLYERGDRRRREMRHLELSSGAQRGHQRPTQVGQFCASTTRSTNDGKRTKDKKRERSLPVVTRDDHSTRARLCALVDEVDVVQSFPLVRRPQLLREIVIADASRAHHRLGWQDVLKVVYLDRRRTRASNMLTAAACAAFWIPPARYVTG